MGAPLKNIDPARLALLVVDVQMAFAQFDAEGRTRSTPEAEDNIRRLLDGFRARGGMICHIHHHSHEPGSPFTAGLPGNAVQPCAAPRAGETVYIKHVSSGFIGTSLEADLRSAGIAHVLLCGAEANRCVETTARMAGNLGFDMLYASDAVWAYGATGPDGRHHTPEEVLSMTLCNMQGEFGTVVTADEALALLGD
jgi:nicotinamidase-related amidase